MEPKVCPRCGATQQWENWRLCSCGYDFGPAIGTAAKVFHPKSGALRYRTFIARVGAGFIDGICLFPAGLLVLWLVQEGHPAFAKVLGGMINCTLPWLYSVALHTKYGQTWGKMAMDVRVCDVSEERLPTLRQALLRDIGNIVSSTLSLFFYLYGMGAGTLVPGGIISRGQEFCSYAASTWFLLEVVTMLTNRKRRALHDYIAGTVVISVEVRPFQ